MKSSRRERTQITPALKERVAKLRKKARNYLIKTEIVQFRLDQPSYEALFSLAERERKPIGTLVREWVTARTKNENISSSQTQTAGTANEIRKMIRQEIDAALKKRRNPRKQA